MNKFLYTKIPGTGWLKRLYDKNPDLFGEILTIIVFWIFPIIFLACIALFVR
jgi:hypothetical protein